MRALLVAKRSGRDARIATLNQIRHLGFTAPDELRERLRGVSRHDLAEVAGGLPTAGTDHVLYATKLALRTLGRRAIAIDAGLGHVDLLLTELVAVWAPGLLGVNGVGVDTAAILLVAAGDNPERIRSEAAFAKLCGVAPLPASSGKTTRYRLNPGGNRRSRTVDNAWPKTSLSSLRVTPHWFASTVGETLLDKQTSIGTRSPGRPVQVSQNDAASVPVEGAHYRR
jgi:transposase